MDENELYRMVGSLEAQVRGLSVAVTELQGSVNSLREALSQTKGGWKVLLLVGTVSTVCVEALYQIFKLLTGR